MVSYRYPSFSGLRSKTEKGLPSPELLRWDVHPFVMLKTASLPKYALQQLKDSILDEIPVLDGDKNGWWPDDSDDENSNQEGNLIPQVHENDNQVLQDRLLENTLTPSKRFGSDLIAANLVGAVNGNKDSICNDLQVNANKFKLDATCTVQSFEQIPITLNGDEQLEDETERSSTKGTEMEGDNMRKDSQAGEGEQIGNAQNADIMVEQNVVMVVPSHVENAALQKSPGGDANENFNQGFPLSCPISSSADGLQQNNVPVKANADVEHPRAEQMSEHEDERINIVLKKSLFLSSQCTPSQDPLGKSGMTEQNFCVKCNKKGKVLVCSANGSHL